jgi:uncharacterized protein YciI
MYFLSINTVREDADHDQIGGIIPSHVQWLKEQIAAGRVAQAGKWGEGGGMAVIRAADLTEARTILSEDPLIRSGLISFELAQFYPMVEMP